MTPTVLFVYGSLKRGRANHGLMAGQHCLGEVETEPLYRLMDLGQYPGLVRDDNGGLSVRGELWAVTAGCLTVLDQFEGSQYSRGKVSLHGASEEADAYFFVGAVPPFASSGAGWPFRPAESRWESDPEAAPQRRPGD